MKKLILLCFLILNTCTFKQLFDIEGYIKGIVEEYRPESSSRIAHCIMKYSSKYNLEPLLITSLARKESQFKHNAYNSTTEARGLGQIIDKYWRYALWHIDNGRLGKHINKKGYTNITQIKRYYYRIGYGTELMCYAARSCIDIADGDVRKGMWIYGGGRGSGSCQTHMSNYLEDIFNIGGAR